MGTPNEAIWPGMEKLPLLSKIQLVKQPVNHLRQVLISVEQQSEDLIYLIQRLLAYNPAVRATAFEAIQSDYLRKSTPLPCHPSMMPLITPAGLREKRQRKQREPPPAPNLGDAFNEEPSNSVILNS